MFIFGLGQSVVDVMDEGLANLAAHTLHVKETFLQASRNFDDQQRRGPAS